MSLNFRSREGHGDGGVGGGGYKVLERGAELVWDTGSKAKRVANVVQGVTYALSALFVSFL